jgi:hypothetical protein
MQPKEKLPVPFADVRPGVAPLQHEERHSEHQHRELQDQAERQRQPLAPFKACAAFEPSPDGRCFVAQPLHEAVDPEQQQIDECKDRAGDDQLLAEKPRQRQVPGERTHDDGGDDDPHHRSDHPEHARGRRCVGAAFAGRAQQGDQDCRQQQARRQGDGDGQPERRLNEPGDAIEQARQAVEKCQQKDETADTGGARVRHGDEPPLRCARGKRRGDERADDEDDHDRLGDQIEQPIQPLGQGLGAGNHGV